MKKIITYLASACLVIALFGVMALPETTLAAPVDEIQKGVNGAGGGGAKELKVYIKLIIDILMWIIGAIAVIVIVVGGIKYVTSDGDAGKIKSAKDTILYAVIGIVVAILSYAIVNFILTNLK